MGSLGNPKIWVPYMNTKDCTQGLCSLYCPQWCYVIFTPPPPPFAFPDDSSGPNFSPLVIAIIGFLASAFLVISYYIVISKYCGNMNSSRRTRTENHGDPDGESEENHGDPSLNDQPWHVSTNGLDESLIKSISICKYKKKNGFLEGTEHCSVCLSEFLEDESLRLLPNCSHAFHLPCIETWLKSHSNCPLCRADIVRINANSPLQSAMTERPRHYEGSSSIQCEHNLQSEREHENQNGAVIPKTPLRAFSDLGNFERRESVIEIREERDQIIRRSVSMDSLSRSRVSVADVLQMNQGEEEARTNDAVGSSKRSMGETSKSDFHRSRVLHYVMNPIIMKRSFSSGKSFFRRQGREQDAVVPV